MLFIKLYNRTSKVRGLNQVFILKLIVKNDFLLNDTAIPLRNLILLIPQIFATKSCLSAKD